jgi:hypothetical protein
MKRNPVKLLIPEALLSLSAAGAKDKLKPWTQWTLEGLGYSPWSDTAASPKGTTKCS